jgi:hypothetical protein
METAPEFMQRFLREKIASQKAGHQINKSLLEKFYGDDYMEYFLSWQDAREKKPERLETVETAESSATAIAITKDPFSRHQQRYRYHLRADGADWKIDGKEWECFACRDTASGGRPNCQFCAGTGWIDHRKTAD